MRFWLPFWTDSRCPLFKIYVQPLSLFPCLGDPCCFFRNPRATNDVKIAQVDLGRSTPEILSFCAAISVIAMCMRTSAWRCTLAGNGNIPEMGVITPLHHPFLLVIFHDIGYSHIYGKPLKNMEIFGVEACQKLGGTMGYCTPWAQDAHAYFLHDDSMWSFQLVKNGHFKIPFPEHDFTYFDTGFSHQATWFWWTDVSYFP